MSALFWLVERMPGRWTPGLSRLVAWLWWWCVPVRRSVAVANLRRALPELDPGPTLRASVADLTLGLLEWVRRDPVHVEWTGLEQVQRACAQGGTLLLSGHCAGFEAALSQAPGLLGVTVSAFARLPSNAAVRARVVELRERCGLVLLPPHGSMAQGIQALEDGGMLAFALDQRRNQGLPIEFFGHPAWTSPGLAAAHRKTGAPVFAAWAVREGPGRLRARIEPLPMSGDVAADTALATAWIEARIREAPTGWLWLHDRWRTP